MPERLDQLSYGQLRQQAIVVMIRDGTPAAKAFDNAEAMDGPRLREFVLLNFSQTDMARMKP